MDKSQAIEQMLEILKLLNYGIWASAFVLLFMSLWIMAKLAKVQAWVSWLVTVKHLEIKGGIDEKKRPTDILS